MLSADVIDLLRDDLLAADYTLSAVEERLQTPALAALGRNSGVAAQRILGDAKDAQADAIRFWLLGCPLPASRLGDWNSLAALRQAGLVAGEERLQATVELKPHGSTRREGWICSDVTGLDTMVTRPRPDFVLGASPASTTLAQLVPQRRWGSVLDLGTGCGIQSLHLDADRILATDLNPRALDLAAISLGLSGVAAELRLGSLYQPVAGERFDLIVTNPPYVISPPTGELVYRESGFTGDDLMRQVVSGAAEHLNPGGYLVVLGNWAHLAGSQWQQRVGEWIPAGCDGLVIERESLDPFEYIEVWLADAGLAGSGDYLEAYQSWLEYFDQLDIVGVGMGWLILRRGGGDDRIVHCESWPHQVAQPVGDALAAEVEALATAGLDNSDLLLATLIRQPGLTQEAIGEPGAPDPQHLVLRQSVGLCRAQLVDTPLAALAGACDGELPLGVLIDAVAEVLEEDAAELAGRLVPRVRDLITQGMLGLTGSHRNPTGSAE